jgi:hypothetical protein
VGDAVVAKALMVTYSRPASPDQEDEYNDWYDNTHLPDILCVPGVVSARRFKLSRAQIGEPDGSLPEYVAVYDLDAPDIQALLDRLRTRRDKGEIYFSDALQKDPWPKTFVYDVRE